MRHSKSIVKKSAISFAVIVFLIFTVFPIYYLFLTSVKPTDLLFATPPVFFFRPTFKTYHTLFLKANYYRYYLNSLIVSGLGTCLVLVLASLASFAFIRFKFFGANILFFLILVTRMYLPMTSTIPLFLVTKQVGLLDTKTALIIIYTAFQLPLAIYILNSFFRAIPNEIRESAEMDGCTPFSFFLKILLPLARPGIIATSILVFVFMWNEFLYALVLTSVNAKTATIALSAFKESEGMIHWPQLSALGFCMMMPVLFFIVFMNKYLVHGILAGSIKG